MDEVKYSKITEDTPIEELKRIHQAIWDYVIENNRKPCTPYVSNCVACEYARTELEKEHDEAVKLLRATTPNTDAYDAQLKVVERLEYTLCVYGTNRLCKNCPIIWPNGVICSNRHSLFYRWINAKTKFFRKRLAKRIRNLPWKFEFERG